MSVAQIDLSEFIQATTATRVGDGWQVCCDPSHDPPRGMINDCEGEDEFEAKESAYMYIQTLKAEIASQ